MKKILLVGNPNSGKTTLFNALSKSEEHVGNWHGVTIENKQKPFHCKNKDFLLVDTPGIYSLCPLSFEEEVSIQTINKMDFFKIINLCDKNNLQRNLYLSLCLLERGCDVVLAINEMDGRSIYSVDCKKLEECLGIDVVKINAQKKIGLENLKEKLEKEREGKRKCLPYIFALKWQFMPKIDQKTYAKLGVFAQNLGKNDGSDYVLIKSFEKDEKFFEQLGINPQIFFDAVPKNSIEILSDLRYKFVEQILLDTTTKTNEVYGKSKLDKLLLNKFFAFPIFFLILTGIFFLTFFSVGSFFSDILASFLNEIAQPILNLILKSIGQGWVFDLFDKAVFGGVSTVVAFLPQVVFLFFFLSILEDSGYLARVAFLFEDIFCKIGLSGKSVYTLLMGFGCSTTAILTSRNMDDKNAKTKTAMLCPYMSCSAKIPIYTVVGGAFFGVKNIFVVLGLYFVGVVVALAVSKILDKTVLKSANQSFILEFPPYRKTSLKRVCKILSKNIKEFLIRIGIIMLAMNIIVWILSSFSFDFSYVVDSNKASILESFAKFLTPIFAPLGFGNWGVVASLLAGVVAKEVVVSSLAIFGGIGCFSSQASALAFLVFCLLYTPCIASMSVLFQEIGGKWTFVSVAIQLVVAYLASLVVYNIAFAIEIFGIASTFAVLFAVVVILFAILCLKKFALKKKCSNICQNCTGKCDRL